MNRSDDSMQEITGRIVLEIIVRYKVIILFSIILMTILAGVFAYLKPNVYRSHTSIKLLDENKNKGNVLSVSLVEEERSSYDEIALLQSSLMLNKVLQRLDLGTRYFYTNKFKIHEMYKESPFVVELFSLEHIIYGKPIYIEPIDQTSFRLSIRDSGFSFLKLKKLIFSKPASPLIFSNTYQYGETITTAWFKIKINKLNEMTKKEYFFTSIPNEYMSGMIANNLSAGFARKGSSVLNISYSDEVPLRAQEVLNAVTQSYFDDEVSEKLKTTNLGLKYLDSQLEALTTLLNKSASQLRNFKQLNTDVILDGSSEEKAKTITESEVKLRKLEFKENILFNLKTYIDTNKDLSSITLENSEISDEALTKNIESFQELNKELRRVLTMYTEFHPQVIKVADEINRLKKKIKFLVDNGLIKVEKEKDYLIRKIKKSKESLVSLPVKENKLAILSRNFEVNEKIYSFLLEKRTEMQILYSSTTPNVRILDHASVPGIPFKPNRKFIVITGVILGFIFGFVISFILYLKNDSIKEISEVEKGAGMGTSFFGKIPYLHKGKYNIAYEEAFRTLRTNLEFLKVDNASKTVVLASSISGEGKSTSVKHIAEVVNKLDKKVIVLDFDLRKPSLHHYFKGIENNNGLSMLLSGQSNLQECIQQTDDKIDILTAGPTAPNPSELIMSEATGLLLQTLSKSYDYILIDTPPYSVVTDATILMQKSDVVLFSIMQEYSKRDCIKHMNSMVSRLELQTSGVIYHGIKLKKQEQHGYGYFHNS